MKDEDLYYNRKDHLIYSKDVKEAVQKQLFNDYPQKEAMLIWENIQRKYVSFLKEQPPIGKGKDTQRQAVYDCILLFAYYDALPSKITLEKFSSLCDEFFSSQFIKMERFDLNKRPLFKAAKAVFAYTVKKNIQKQKDFPFNYHMEMDAAPSDIISYRFTSCPVYDFAKRNNFLFLMPAMCNPDYSSLKCMKASLIRTNTIARNGTFCDFTIVGDKNPILQEHPQKTDEKGYIYNE